MTQRRDALVEGVLHGEDRSVGASLLRGLLTPLSWLHRAGLEAYLLPYGVGLRKRYRLPVPVLSIGNLSSGGTGKTPMAALVAGALQREGKRVVILSRGYRGAGGSGPRIVSDGERTLLGPEEAGDEPALLARLLPGVPVVVGKDRRQSGRLAVERFAPDVIVLDDALQFWQLHRDLDIVLLDAARPFDNGHVLPRGLLREPPSHLSRAGIVVLTRADRLPGAERGAVAARVKALAPRAEVFTAEHVPVGWLRASDGALMPRAALEGEKALAFAGIADTRSFFATARAFGAQVVAERDFGDHHAYTEAEVRSLAAVVCGVAVTTEKDLVKVAPLWPKDGPPLYALRIELKVDDEARFLYQLRRIASLIGPG